MRSTVLVLLLALAACDRGADRVTDNQVAAEKRAARDRTDAPVPRPADGPSFDCGRARGQAQEMVCADKELAAMDREVDRLYRLAGPDKGDVAAAQRDWLAARDQCWRTDDLRQCVLTAYAKRVHQLCGALPATGAEAGANSVGPVAYRCAGLDAPVGATFVNTDPGAVYLTWGPTHELALPRAESASGARYAGRVDGADWTFWIKGREATLSMPGKGDLACAERGER